MSGKKVKYIITVILLLLSNCSKKEKPEESFLKKYDTKEVVGFWKLIPSDRTTFFQFEEDGNAKIFHDNIPEKIVILSDSNGLRVFHNETDEIPFAYFLFNEKRENVWTGLYDNNIVRIERIQIKKKSILE